jgi:hypothetical protein
MNEQAIEKVATAAGVSTQRAYIFATDIAEAAPNGIGLSTLRFGSHPWDREYVL